MPWVFEYLHLCHHSKKKIITLKLDFEKALNKVEHKAILQVIKHLGFSSIWMKWTQSILGSRTSFVLLYGVPRKTFHYKRGVKLGDLLSPSMFAITTDLLLSLINDASCHEKLNLPIPLPYTSDVPILQYVDDTLIIMESCRNQLNALKSLAYIIYKCFFRTTSGGPRLLSLIGTQSVV